MKYVKYEIYLKYVKYEIYLKYVKIVKIQTLYRKFEKK